MEPNNPPQGLDRRSYLKLVSGAAITGGGSATLPAVRGAGALNRTLTIEDTGTLTNYEFTVKGDLAKSTAMGASLNGNNTISGHTATGQLISTHS
jgi:hypothetical protein